MLFITKYIGKYLNNKIFNLNHNKYIYIIFILSFCTNKRINKNLIINFYYLFP